MDADTISLAEIRDLAQVNYGTVNRWLHRGLLPQPLAENGPGRRRSYRFDRQAVLAALEKIREAKAVLAGSKSTGDSDASVGQRDDG